MRTTKVIIPISILGFFAIFSTTMSKNPVLPLFTDALGGNSNVIGLISSISPLAGIILSFPVGFMSDKVGKKMMLVIAALCFCLSPLLYLFVNSAWQLIPIRFVHGMSTAILSPVASAIIASSYKENKGQMLGTYSSATLIGRTIAPLAGGFIIAAFSASQTMLYSYKAVYLIASIASIPVVVVSLLLNDDAQKLDKKVTIKDMLGSLHSIVTNRVLFAVALIDCAIYFCFGIFETFTPGYLKSIGFGTEIIGMVFSLQVIAIALTKPLFGMLADTIDNRWQIAAGVLILALSIVIIPHCKSYVSIISVCILTGLGMSISTVATSVFTADCAKKDSLGASMGALSSVMDIGHSSGPLIAGMIIGAASVKSGFIAGALFAICIVAYFLFTVLSDKRLRSVIRDS
jgi:MFS family permease